MKKKNSRGTTAGIERESLNPGSIDILRVYNSVPIPVAIYDLNSHIQAFVVGTQNFGDKDSEYKLFLDYSYFFGFQFTY